MICWGGSRLQSRPQRQLSGSDLGWGGGVTISTRDPQRGQSRQGAICNHNSMYTRDKLVDDFQLERFTHVTLKQNGLSQLDSPIV